MHNNRSSTCQEAAGAAARSSSSCGSGSSSSSCSGDDNDDDDDAKTTTPRPTRALAQDNDDSDDDEASLFNSQFSDPTAGPAAAAAAAGSKKDKDTGKKGKKGKKDKGQKGKYQEQGQIKGSKRSIQDPCRSFMTYSSFTLYTWCHQPCPHFGCFPVVYRMEPHLSYHSRCHTIPCRCCSYVTLCNIPNSVVSHRRGHCPISHIPPMVSMTPCCTIAGP
jgi:hypothetical protein